MIDKHVRHIFYVLAKILWSFSNHPATPTTARCQQHARAQLLNPCLPIFPHHLSTYRSKASFR